MPAHRQAQIYCQLRGPGTEQHHRQEGEEELLQGEFSHGAIRGNAVCIYRISAACHQRRVRELVLLSAGLRKGERTQQRNYIENNKLQDPFYQQVFVPLFLAKGKEKGHYISISPDGRDKPDKFVRIEGNYGTVEQGGKARFQHTGEGQSRHAAAGGTVQAVRRRTAGTGRRTGKLPLKRGYYMCQQLNAHMEAGSYWIGRRHHNKKRNVTNH